VPADAKNAIKGEWVDGPGTRIFDFLFADFGREVFIAEDLGEIDDAVDALLKDINLPGMRVLQFGFDPDSDSTHLPCFYPRNCVAYTGTHDNNTLLGWLWDIDERQRRFALDYIGFYSQEVDWGQGGPDARVIRAFVRTVWATAAELTIVPVQDLLGYGGDTRMNTPGLGSDQWRYRVTAQDLAKIDQKWLLRLNTIYRRGPQVNSIMDITKLK
jgi:4-alpha-glucanotransferase